MNRLLAVSFLCFCFAGIIHAQDSEEFTSRIETPRGILEVYSDTLANMEGLLSGSPVLSLVPKEGVSVARARITEGTEVTEYRGSAIEYNTATDALTITGNARIIRDENLFEGSEQITFDPENQKMLIVGTKKTPARIRYREGKMAVDSRQPIFEIIFAENDDKKLRMQSARSLEKL